MSLEGEPKTVLCFGDSLTWGFDPRGGAAFRRYGIAERWTCRLGTELGGGYHLIEAGLNGRTTVFDDPVLGGMSGLADLANTLKSHMPVDLLVLMLGSNDVKPRMRVNADEIARCLARLLQLAATSGCGPQGQAPRILVLIPPPIGDVAGRWLEPIYGGEWSRTQSHRLHETYPPVAAQFAAACFDTSDVVGPCQVDGVHFDPDMLQPLAEALAGRVRDLLELDG
jgi:lysophospholipase L1-like esterase